MPIDRDGDGPPLRRQQSKVSLTPGEGRSSDLRATPFTDEVFDDDYYGRRPRKAEGSRSLSVVVGIVLGIAVAGGAGYYFLHGSGMTLTPGEMSFVKADPTPYKIRPDNPGGMQVENQDKLVYDRVAKGTAPARVENLLPPAEEPKAPPMKPKEEAPKVEAPKVEEPKAAAAPEPVKEPVKEAPPPAKEAPAKEPEVAKEEPKAAAGKPVQLVPQAAAPSSTPAKPEADPLAAAVAAATGGREAATGPIASPPQAAAPKAAAPAPVAETPKPAPAAEPPKAEPPKAEPPKPVQTATATGGVYQIQLASVLSEQAALAEWGRISNKNKDILGSYSPTVVRADLGEKGVFYRLRAGPVADKAAADALCASLTAANVGCIVVKP